MTCFVVILFLQLIFYAWGLISASDLCISFHAVIVVDNTKTIASTNMGFGLEGRAKRDAKYECVTYQLHMQILGKS